MYNQKIETFVAKREKTLLYIKNYESVPRRCYCRFERDGYVRLTIYTVSQDDKYLVAEGDSDHTVFMLLKILEKDADMYQTEYIGDAYNPMDEMYSRLCGVSWYEEQGFCKLEFFNMDYIPDPHNVCRRIYFNNREKKSGE